MRSVYLTVHASPDPVTGMANSQVLLEAGVLAYRQRKRGELEILLVGKRWSKKWGIPKGRVEPHLSFGELAAKETFEEAGVVVYVSANSVGVFGARKQNTPVDYLIRSSRFGSICSRSPIHDGNGLKCANARLSGFLAKWPRRSYENLCSRTYVIG